MQFYKLTPACKDNLWGGDTLRQKFGIQSSCQPLAEAWVLSCHPAGPSLLPDGTPLPVWLADHPKAAGTHCTAFAQFPVLIKLIDARKPLSIQVHPSDAYALEHEGQYGKTEMWLVLDAAPGASLYYGVKKPLTRTELAEHIADGTVTEVLNDVPVKAGDVFFIPSGTMHAIGAGIVVAEVQQNSNVTYRVYDYGRKGPDGKPRALHIEQAVAVADLEPVKVPDFGAHLASCRYFTADTCKAPFTGTVDETSFLSLLVLDGHGTLVQNGQSAPLHPGDSYFLPANSGDFHVEGDCRCLLTRV